MPFSGKDSIINQNLTILSDGEEPYNTEFHADLYQHNDATVDLYNWRGFAIILFLHINKTTQRLLQVIIGKIQIIG